MTQLHSAVSRSSCVESTGSNLEASFAQLLFVVRSGVVKPLCSVNTMSSHHQCKSTLVDQARRNMDTVVQWEQELQDERKRLSQLERALKRKAHAAETRARDIALNIFIRDCPDASTAMLFFSLKCPDLVAVVGMEAMQHQLETRYCQLTSDDIDRVLDHAWSNGRTVRDEASRFPIDARMLHHTEAANVDHGVAP